MDNGRDFNPDHDQKSVEFPTRRKSRPKKPRAKAQRRPIMVSRKTCSTCKHEYKAEAFAFDESSPSGLQAQCRSCRRQWERGGIMSRARAHIERKGFEPAWVSRFGSVENGLNGLWNEAGGLCEWCGAGLNEWQASGHCLDRTDSDYGYTPGNVHLACWPCNCTKQSMSPETWAEWIESKVKRYGRGRVPHSSLNPKRFKRSKDLNLSHLLVCEYRQINLCL